MDQWVTTRIGRRSSIVSYSYAATPAIAQAGRVPVAASFAMAVAAGGDGKLAANIIALTTLASIATMTIGIYALIALGH